MIALPMKLGTLSLVAPPVKIPPATVAARCRLRGDSGSFSQLIFFSVRGTGESRSPKITDDVSHVHSVENRS
jgi:hypothetical protein